jgi:hypothetical protein
MAGAHFAILPLQEYGANMKRRYFLKLLLLGSFFSFFSKKASAVRKPPMKLKEALFWKKVDRG